MNQQLSAAADRLEDWIWCEAMPLWLRVGIEPETGAHYERLTPEGEPELDANVRLRVQARQALVYALAYERGWAGAEAKAAAERLLAFMRERTARANGGYPHLLNCRFEVIDSRQDLYDHAFYILGNAWCYRALGDAQALREAQALVAHIDRHFGADNGGWLEGDYPSRYRRQNPHMHLFEAFLALFEATRESRWLARAGEIFTLFENRFYDAGQRVLREYFQRDWSLANDGVGQLVEPGHMLEWVWLLDKYGSYADRPVSRLTEALYHKALAIGVTDSGLVLDAVTASGEVISATKRCWPMTELIKASVVLARHGDSEAGDRAAVVEVHPDPFDLVEPRQAGGIDLPQFPLDAQSVRRFDQAGISAAIVEAV
jgi:mannose/cellobiose epimerase-like protein (N-acyl-D-glucosamine 2-epimerase family)